MELDDILSTQQAASLCGVDRRTMLRWVDAGIVQSHRTAGGWRRIRAADLLAFMEESGMPIPRDLRRAPLSVVVIDDDKRYAKALCRRIEKFRPDARLSVAHDGFHGGVLVAELEPSLVLLDVLMPGLDGYEVCRQLQAREHPPRIIAMSGQITDAGRRRLLTLGAEQVLDKPVASEELAELFADETQAP